MTAAYTCECFPAAAAPFLVFYNKQYWHMHNSAATAAIWCGDLKLGRFRGSLDE